MRGCERVRFLFPVLLLTGLIVSPVRAQSFGPPVPTELVLVLLDREGTVRFTLSSYYTQWQNPFRITESVFSGLLGRRVRTNFRLIASTPASPLFEGKYVLSRR